MATDPPAQLSPSLIGRLARWRGGVIRARAAVAVGALLVAAPVATLGGAMLLTMRAIDDRLALERNHAAELARARAGADQRRDLAAALRVTGVGATAEALATTLPREAMLVRAARDGGGRLTLEVMTSDPDRLRAALRRDAATAGLRDAGQRRGDGGLIVTLVES